MNNRPIRFLLYALWGFFALFLCAYLTFPTEKMSEVIQSQLEAGLGYEYEINIGDVSLSGLSGVVLEDVHLRPITMLSSNDEEESENNQIPRIALPTQIERLRIKAGLFSLLSGTVNLRFEILLAGGQIDGSFTSSPEDNGNNMLVLNIRELHLPQLGILLNTLQSSLSGTATGYVELTLDPTGLPLTGSVVATLTDLVRAEGPQPVPNVPVGPYLKLTDMGNLWLTALVDESAANITLSNRTPENPDIVLLLRSTPQRETDIEFHMDGRLTLRNPFGESLARLVMQVGFKDQWYEENDWDNIVESGIIPVLRQSCENRQCAMTFTGPLTHAALQPWRRN
jgi:type II secretion system protein N